jgi:RNA polymerase sigma-70 factor (ECF subfamily)
MDTPELISAAQAGDFQAFNRLVLDHQDTLYSLASYLCPGQEAEPLMRSTVQRIYRDLPTCRETDFHLWLVTMVVKSWRSAPQPRRFWRKQARSGQQNEPTLHTSASRSRHPVSPGRMSPEIRDCLLDLPPELRVVMILVDLEGLSYVQAASALGVPKTTVRKRLAKGRRVLSNQLPGAFLS